MNRLRCRCKRWQWLSIGAAFLSAGVTFLLSRNAIAELDTVTHLTKHIVINQKPVFIRPPESLASDLTTLGLNGFASWKERHGNETVSLGEDADNDVKVNTFGLNLVSTYVDILLDPHRTKVHEKEFHLRMSESWGSYWLFSRPSMIQALSRLYEPLVPLGYQDGLQFSNEELARMTRQQKQEDHTFVLWAAPSAYAYSIHVDYVSGTLLTHLDGNKTVWLYPPSQAKYLYLFSKEANWEAVSPVDPKNPDFLSFPMFALARPTVIDLAKGDVVFIPCGWPHFIYYVESAMSLGVNLFPDWLEKMENNCSAQGKEYIPSSCGDLLVRPTLVQCV